MCAMLIYGKMGWFLLSWSRERSIDVCYLGVWNTGLMFAILVYGRMG